jgi:hypothetical protein
VEDKIALSDRFGLWLSFYPFTQAHFLDVVVIQSLFLCLPRGPRAQGQTQFQSGASLNDTQR